MSERSDSDDEALLDRDPVVLVVDDEEDLANLYSQWLSDDYAVRTAYNGEQALERLDETVDVVLLDRRMPGLSGDDALNRIREREYDCRVAMVTAVDPDTISSSLDSMTTSRSQFRRRTYTESSKSCSLGQHTTKPSSSTTPQCQPGPPSTPRNKPRSWLMTSAMLNLRPRLKPSNPSSTRHNRISNPMISTPPSGRWMGQTMNKHTSGWWASGRTTPTDGGRIR